MLSNLDLYFISFFIYPRLGFLFVLLATETILILLHAFMYNSIWAIPTLSKPFFLFYEQPIPWIKRQILRSSQNIGFPKVKSSLIFLIIFKNLKHGYNTYIKLTQIFFFFLKKTHLLNRAVNQNFISGSELKWPLAYILTVPMSFDKKYILQILGIKNLRAIDRKI